MIVERREPTIDPEWDDPEAWLAEVRRAGRCDVGDAVASRSGDSYNNFVARHRDAPFIFKSWEELGCPTASGGYSGPRYYPADIEAAEARRQSERRRHAADEALQAARERAAALLLEGRVRNQVCVAIGSLTCLSCGLADQLMMLPPPGYDNLAGYFEHVCRCGRVYGLGSKQLARECDELRALAR